MNTKDVMRLLAPPLFLDLGKRLHRKAKYLISNVSDIEFEYIPDGWNYVARYHQAGGWDSVHVLETYKRKWLQFNTKVEGNSPLGFSHEGDLTTNTDLSQHNTIMTFAYSVTLASRNLNTLSILDWGGGIGHYYLLVKSVLPNVVIEYHCKDLPIFTTFGQELFSDQHFYTDNSCLKRRYDFVMASSSLNYSEDWENVLAALAGASQGYLFVTRLPTVVEAPSFVYIQRPYSFGYNTEYLGWCLNRTTFLTTAQTLDLSLVREFIVSEFPHIHKGPEQPVSRGFLFRARIDSETESEAT